MFNKLAAKLSGKWVGKGSIQSVEIEIPPIDLSGARSINISCDLRTLDRFNAGDWLGYNYVISPKIDIKF